MQPYLTQEEYQTLAERYVKNFVSRRRLNCKIIDDPDAINCVVDYMMRADSKFDGRGDSFGFRYSYAKFGFQEYMTKNRGAKKKKLYNKHLSTFTKSESERVYDGTRDDHEPNEAMADYELRKRIENSSLTDRQKDTIIGCFYDQRTRAEIAKKWNCSRQLIDVELKNALRKLKIILKDFA